MEQGSSSLGQFLTNHSCTIIVTSENVIGFANGNFLHCHDMAENVVKHCGRYCVAGGPNKVSCKNTSYIPGISMRRFPKDVHLRRLWTQFVRHHTNLEPSEHSALCSANFEPTCFQRKLSLGDEAADKTHRTLLKQGSMPNVDTVAPPTEDQLSYTDRDQRGERRHTKQVRHSGSLSHM